MKLRRLSIDRLPGITKPFTLEPGDGVNLLVGPNASGKSSVARAVRRLLWPDRKAAEAFLVEARFDAGGDLVAKAVGTSISWARDGFPIDTPALPGDLLAGCYNLTVSDLLLAGGAVTGDLARDIRREMAGGFDLDRVRADVAANQPTTRKASDLLKIREAARQQAGAVKQEQEALAEERGKLQELQDKADAATGALLRAEALGAMKAAAEAQDRLAEAERRAAGFDAAVAQVRPSDADDFLRARKRHSDMTAQRNKAEADAARLEQAMAACGVPADVVAPAELERIAVLLAAVRTAESTRREAAATCNARRQVLEATHAAAAEPREPRNVLAILLRLAAERTGDAEAAAAPAATPAKNARFAVPFGIVAAALVAAAAAPADLAPLIRGGLALLGIVAGFLAARMAMSAAAARQAQDLARRLDAAAAPARDLAEQARRGAEDLAAGEAAVAVAEAALAEALKAMAAALAPWGEPAPANCAEAEAAEAAARGKSAELQTLSRQRADAQDAVETSTQEMNHAAETAGAILERLGLPAGTVEAAPIRALIDQLAAWKDADNAVNRARASAESSAESARKKCADAGLDDGITVTPDIDIEIAQQRQIADDARGHAEAVGTLKARLKDAEEGHDLAEAQAALAGAEGDIERWLDGALDEAFALALLEEMQAAHESSATPPRLAEANRLLADFTHNRYELRVGGGADTTAFMVRDLAEGAHLDLASVSDGTRTQILLALRVAYIAAMEGGARLPLFLDEALTTTDPVRLQAVARSLGLLARNHDRQVFYLTSQQADVAAWTAALEGAGLPAPTVLDLGLIRGLAQAAPDDVLRPAATPPVPAPAGMDPVAYGRLLRVPNIDGRGSWEQVPVFYLVGRDMDLAHALYAHEIRFAGVLAGALEQLAASGVVSADQAVHLRLALDVLAAFLPLWVVGRPAPVPWEEVVASGAVSETFVAPIRELHHRCRGDAGAIIDGIAQKAVSGFLAKKRDDLAQHLEEQGYLDPRDPLADDEILRRVLLQTSSQAEARTAPEAVRALVDRLLGALGAEGAD
jgi:exonuclease SbcC